MAKRAQLQPVIVRLSAIVLAIDNDSITSSPFTEKGVGAQAELLCSFWFVYRTACDTPNTASLLAFANTRCHIMYIRH
jgi:hypothetical protein